MATFWIDLRNGNDANAGTYAAPWLTFANGPTAARIAPGDEIRVMRTGVATLANTTWTNGSASVTIPAGTVLDIDTAVGNTWTAAANVTAGTSTVRRLGATSQQFAVAAAFTTGKIAHKATGTLNLSGYTKFSFNLRVTSALSPGAFTIRLCSDTTGDTPVHTFTTPLMSQNVMYQFTFNNNAPLSSSIQSVSISAAIDPGTSNIQINNIIAHNDLGLGCLVGPSDAESFFPILSISANTLLIDNSYSVNATSSAWEGVSGTYTMTIRDSIFTQSNNVNMNEASTQLDFKLSGGWQDETTQNGYTIIRNTGIAITQTGWTIENMGVCNTGQYGFSANAPSILFLKNIVVSNTSSSAISLLTKKSTLDGLNIYSCATTIESGPMLRIQNSNIYFNANSLSVTPGWEFLNCKFKYLSSSAAISTIPSDVVVMRKCEYSGTLYGSEYQSNGGVIVEEQTVGSSYPVVMNYAFGKVRWQTVTKQGSDPGAWEATGVTNSRTQYNPIEFSLGQLLCTSGVAKTVSVWMMKDHATNLQMALFVEGSRLNGVNEVQTIKADDTSWQQVSVTFTPTETGVIGIFARVWATASGATGYVGSLTES